MDKKDFFQQAKIGGLSTVSQDIALHQQSSDSDSSEDSQLSGCSYSHSSQSSMSLAPAEMLSNEEAAPPSVQAPNFITNRSQMSGDVSADEASRRRELRLMKSREARRKKTEYLKAFLNRVAMLEKLNKTFLEREHIIKLELQATKPKLKNKKLRKAKLSGGTL